MQAAFAAGFQPKPLAFQLADFGGRSGYWRLVFAKMQEEALKESVKEAPKQDATVVETKPPAKKPRIVRRRPIAPPEIHERPVLSSMLDVRTLFDELGELAPLNVTPITIKPRRITEEVAKQEEVRIRRKRRQVEELLLLLAA